MSVSSILHGWSTYCGDYISQCGKSIPAVVSRRLLMSTTLHRFAPITYIKARYSLESNYYNSHQILNYQTIFTQLSILTTAQNPPSCLSQTSTANTSSEPLPSNTRMNHQINTTKFNLRFLRCQTLVRNRQHPSHHRAALTPRLDRDPLRQHRVPLR